MVFKKIPPFFGKAIAAIFFGGLLFALSLALVLVGMQTLFKGRILPGVTVGNIDLGGKQVDQAFLFFLNGMEFPEMTSIRLQFQDKTWEASPSQLGISFDPGTTLLHAYEVGRSGSWDRRLGSLVGIFSARHPVAPVFIFNQNTTYQFLEMIAPQINQPAREAELVIRGTRIEAVPGQTGYLLDIPASIQLLTEAIIHKENSILPLVVIEKQPEVMDASEFAADAQKILSGPLTLTAASDTENTSMSWKFSPEELAAMLTFNRINSNSGTAYEVKFNEQMLNNILLTIAGEANRVSQNPRFIFNDDTHQLELTRPGIVGRALNPARSISAIQNGISEGKQSIPLEFDLNEPAVNNNMSGEGLGIRELVHSEVSYFYGSSRERVQNIQTAASQFHGLLIAPGENFSMAQALGDVSLNNGYAEALIIYNGQTIQGVGGGVCQVSTALFRAAFFSGFPITERHPHAYRVKYYEKEYGNRLNSRLAGLDATVYVPVVDLKFTNDTPYWLLMETYVSPQNSTLNWKFYSTNDGRRVQWNSSGPTNLVEPPKPLYRENASLKKGEIKQVDWEAQGADVLVSRLVYNQDNSVRFQDDFNTHYEPWRAIHEYGPGTEGIPNYETP